MLVTVTVGGQQHKIRRNLPGIAPELNVEVEIRRCDWCKDQFSPEVPKQRFCSSACRNVAHRKGLPELEAAS